MFWYYLMFQLFCWRVNWQKFGNLGGLCTVDSLEAALILALEPSLCVCFFCCSCMFYHIIFYRTIVSYQCEKHCVSTSAHERGVLWVYVSICCQQPSKPSSRVARKDKRLCTRMCDDTHMKCFWCIDLFFFRVLDSFWYWMTLVYLLFS